MKQAVPFWCAREYDKKYILPISEGNADGIFVGEKCEHFFRLNVCIEFRVSSMFGQSDGACPTHRRQWADFLVSLMAPLHRQYKTARTELAGICYWSQGRWRLRQRLRAVMFCSEVPIRDIHKSPTNCLPGCGHDPRSAPNLEKHGSSKMQTFGWLEIPHFLKRISISISTWNLQVCFI